METNACFFQHYNVATSLRSSLDQKAKATDDLQCCPLSQSWTCCKMLKEDWKSSLIDNTTMSAPVNELMDATRANI